MSSMQKQVNLEKTPPIIISFLKMNHSLVLRCLLIVGRLWDYRYVYWKSVHTYLEKIQTLKSSSIETAVKLGSLNNTFILNWIKALLFNILYFLKDNLTLC